jgi:hypothetical protein
MAESKNNNMAPPSNHSEKDPEAYLSDSRHNVYRSALNILSKASFPFLVGGAFALRFYTGIRRDTHDIDLFILPQDYERGLQLLSEAGFETSRTFPHWLGKATYGEHQIDIIFSSGNAIGRVDPIWFEHSAMGEILGTTARICPPEEMIWSKAFVMERERYDGADILHILLFRGGHLDWRRLLDRFGPHWRVLLSYLVQFGFVYPSKRQLIPDPIMRELLNRLNTEMRQPPAGDSICQGTLLSREQYRPDVEAWGFLDARLQPLGEMTEEEIELWRAPDSRYKSPE